MSPGKQLIKSTEEGTGTPLPHESLKSYKNRYKKAKYEASHTDNKCVVQWKESFVLYLIEFL